MISKRIKLIASLLDENDRVLDIGTDHALLPIYLIQNNIVSIADGSDISEKVLESAYRNVSTANLEDKINLFLSDGLKNININNYNTLVIAGMGYTTIKGILDLNDTTVIKKLIIQTNNDYEKLREYLIKNDYVINKEICIKDKSINYIIFNVAVGKSSLGNEELLCGVYNQQNVWYYKEMVDHLKEILKRIPKTNKEKILQIEHQLVIYSDYISR